MSKAARMAGFRTLPLSRQSTVEVVAAIDGFGDVAAVDRRHALEDLLNEQLGWLGLGYCDGGSTGSGSTEVFCIVQDAPTARRLLPQILADGGFSEFQIRR